MLDIKIKNHKNETLSLTGNQNYTLYAVEGLDPSTANINTATNATMDGSTFRSAKINQKNIVLYLAVEEPCEANRVALYGYVKPKQPVTVYIKTGARNVYIEGYVESIQVGFFEQKESVQISIICPSPFFKMAQASEVEISTTESGFEFPFSIPEVGIPFSEIMGDTEKYIINTGDIETGALITLYATADGANPMIYLPYNNTFFALDFDFCAGDTIIINTVKGQKSVTLIRDGEKSNIINTLRAGSSWLQFESGQNLVGYSATPTSSISCDISIDGLYEGV